LIIDVFSQTRRTRILLDARNGTAGGLFSRAMAGDNAAWTDSWALIRSTIPAPEPSTWALMLLCFAGLGCAGYRRAKELRAA
jgi:hypothetical protein